MTHKTFGMSIALLLFGTALLGCGRGAISSASNAAPTSRESTKLTAQKPIESAQLWFVQLSPAVKNLDTVAEEVAQRINAEIQQKLPVLRAFLLTVPTGSHAKELLKDVRVRLVVTEKEYLTNNMTQPSPSKPKSTTPSKKTEKKK